MTLPAGMRLGPYEIVAPAGAGGMGEVYRATDTRLARTVAIKILPAELSDDAKLRQRLEQEARSISRLSHPHICTLFDVGHQEGVDFLVLEYLEGEPLDERMKRGGLSLVQVLQYATEIAGALDAAHRRGITHRDLKPANIMLTKSGAKLLDFGLARPATAGVVSSEALTMASAGAHNLTAEGTIVGTLQYMAPEQLQGNPVDARTDIFALGCVIYEMATRRAAFAGGSKASLIAAILASEPPPLSSLRPLMPPALDRLVNTCLAKDPDNRMQNARDVSLELAWIGEAAASSRPTKVGDRRKWLWVGCAAVFGAALAAAILWPLASHQTQSSQRLVRFSISLPADASIDPYVNSAVAISADGKLLAYAASRGDERGLYVQSLDNLEPKWLSGTNGATNPFFSPDARWLGFQSGNTLKKIPLDGGAPQIICDTPYFVGATWAPDDTIIYTPVFTAGLWSIAAGGGQPHRLSTPDTKVGEFAHLWPDVLPSGKAVLFTVLNGKDFDDAQIALLSLETGEKRTLLQGGYFARYSSTGHILYTRTGRLMAVPFDLPHLKVTGEPVAVLPGVLSDLSSAGATFSVSRNGTLAYVPGTAHNVSRSLVWVDRKGQEHPVNINRRPILGPRVSPDGRRIGLWLEEATTDVWIYELQRETLSKITYGSDDHSVSWSPDGRRVAFESSRSGLHHVYVRASDGTGTEEQITFGDYEEYLGDWSPDGRYLAYTQFHPKTGADVWVVSLEKGHQSRPLLRTRFAEKAPVFSPDGRWVAYVSSASGQYEVYVQPLEGPVQQWQISSGGGEEPVWARSGRELFYRSGGKLMAVPVTTRPAFSAGKPAPLFSGLYQYNGVPNRCYDVAPDGRFVMVKTDSENSRQINVVLGWPASLSR